MSRNRNRNRNRGPKSQQPANTNTGQKLGFRFKHDGRTYTIPPASEATERLQAGVLMDMAEDSGEAAQLKFFMAMLKAAEPSDEAMQALRSMPLKRFGNVMRQWAERSGGHPGKSAPSSDS